MQQFVSEIWIHAQAIQTRHGPNGLHKYSYKTLMLGCCRLSDAPPEGLPYMGTSRN